MTPVEIGIQRGAGLVHQQDLGPRRDRARDAQALLLAAGEAQRGAVQVVLDLLVEPGAPQGIDYQRLELGPARAAAGLLAQREGDVVEDRHREGVGLLEDHRHARAQRRVFEVVDVVAVEHDAPAAGSAGGELGEAVQGAQQRGLAAAGGSDQREHLALVDRERDRAHRDLLAVGDARRPPGAGARVRRRRGPAARPRAARPGGRARERGRARSCARAVPHGGGGTWTSSVGRAYRVVMTRSRPHADSSR